MTSLPRVSIAAAVVVLFAACGGTAATGPHDTPVPLGHVHGVGVDPADDVLYVATHTGLFRVDGSRPPERVADRYQDTMALTVTGPGRFLASGHPDPAEDLPVHLGLIESTDAGRTWRALALQGEADFHVLEAVGGTLFGFDASTGRLLATEDRRTFREIARGPLTSLTAHPTEPQRLWGTAGSGRVVDIDVASGAVTPTQIPALALIETAPDGSLVGIGPAGEVMVSDDAGGTWSRRSSIGGAPAAFTASGSAWFAATEHRVFRSSDGGRTWDRVL